MIAFLEWCWSELNEINKHYNETHLKLVQHIYQICYRCLRYSKVQFSNQITHFVDHMLRSVLPVIDKFQSRVQSVLVARDISAHNSRPSEKLTGVNWAVNRKHSSWSWVSSACVSRGVHCLNQVVWQTGLEDDSHKTRTREGKQNSDGIHVCQLHVIYSLVDGVNPATRYSISNIL